MEGVYNTKEARSLLKCNIRQFSSKDLWCINLELLLIEFATHGTHEEHVIVLSKLPQ